MIFEACITYKSEVHARVKHALISKQLRYLNI